MRRSRAAAALLVLGALFASTAPATAATTEIRKARERANAAAQELSDAESQLAVLEGRIADLRAQHEATRAMVDQLGSTVREIAVRQYISQELDGGALVFSGADLNESVRAEALARFVTVGSTDAIDRYAAAAQDLTALDAQLAAEQQRQEAAIEQLETKRAALQAELARLIEIERKRQEEEARRRREEEARRQAEAAAAARRAAARPNSAASTASSGGGGGRVIASGGWVCPVQGPRAFGNDFGAPRSGGRRHQGNDILAPRGTPVVAPVAGSVTFRSVRLGGRSFFLQGVDGNRYFGTHLQGYEGGNRNVQAGEVIAYVGDDGNARGTPHLHFEISPGGRGVINPYPTLRANC